MADEALPGFHHDQLVSMIQFGSGSRQGTDRELRSLRAVGRGGWCKRRVGRVPFGYWASSPCVLFDSAPTLRQPPSGPGTGRQSCNPIAQSALPPDDPGPPGPGLVVAGLYPRADPAGLASLAVQTSRVPRRRHSCSTRLTRPDAQMTLSLRVNRHPSQCPWYSSRAHLALGPKSGSCWTQLCDGS